MTIILLLLLLSLLLRPRNTCNFCFIKVSICNVLPKLCLQIWIMPFLPPKEAISNKIESTNFMYHFATFLVHIALLSTMCVEWKVACKERNLKNAGINIGMKSKAFLQWLLEKRSCFTSASFISFEDLWKTGYLERSMVKWLAGTGRHSGEHLASSL